MGNKVRGGEGLCRHPWTRCCSSSVACDTVTIPESEQGMQMGHVRRQNSKLSEPEWSRNSKRASTELTSEAQCTRQQCVRVFGSVSRMRACEHSFLAVTKLYKLHSELLNIPFHNPKFNDPILCSNPWCVLTDAAMEHADCSHGLRRLDLVGVQAERTWPMALKRYAPR